MGGRDLLQSCSYNVDNDLLLPQKLGLDEGDVSELNVADKQLSLNLWKLNAGSCQ